MIAANNVTLRIGKKALFEDVNIKFTEGNCYGLIGANGAGKSTFLKILSGQLETTNGDITITPTETFFPAAESFKYVRIRCWIPLLWEMPVCMKS